MGLISESETRINTNAAHARKAFEKVGIADQLLHEAQQNVGTVLTWNTKSVTKNGRTSLEYEAVAYTYEPTGVRKHVRAALIRRCRQLCITAAGSTLHPANDLTPNIIQNAFKNPGRIEPVKRTQPPQTPSLS